MKDRDSALARLADRSLAAMFQADRSFNDPIWLKPVAGANRGEIHGSLAEYSRFLPPAQTKKAKSKTGLFCVTLRWLFPVPLLELVADATRVKRISLDEQTLALALNFNRLFGARELSIRFRPEVFAFGVSAEAYNFERLAIYAHNKLASFVRTLLHRTVKVDADLNVSIDLEVQTFSGRDTDQRKKRLLLGLAACWPSFSNEEFCELYDGSKIEASKTCGRLLDDLASILPGLDWDSAASVKTIKGVDVEFDGDREKIKAACRTFLRSSSKNRTGSSPQEVDSTNRSLGSTSVPANLRG